MMYRWLKEDLIYFENCVDFTFYLQYFERAMNAAHSGAISPVVINTRGTNYAFSLSHAFSVFSILMKLNFCISVPYNIALCRKLTCGPRLQDRLWSMSFFFPQTQNL